MLHSRDMSPPAIHSQGPSKTPSLSMGVPFISEIHIDGVGMGKEECSGREDSSAGLGQPLPNSWTVPALLISHPPMGAHVPDKDKGLVTHHHLQLCFWHAPRHDSAHPNHMVPGRPWMLREDLILGTSHPLQQGGHSCAVHPHSWGRGPVSVTGSDAAPCLHLSAPSSHNCP